MKRKELEKQKKVYVRKVEVLFKVTKMVKEKTNIKVVLDCLLSLVQELLSSDQAQIFLYDEFTNAQNCEISSIGNTKTSRPGIAHPAEYLVVTHVTDVTKEGFLIEDVSNFVNVALGMGTASSTSSVKAVDSSSGEDNEVEEEEEDEVIGTFDGDLSVAVAATTSTATTTSAAASVAAVATSTDESVTDYCKGLKSIAGIVCPISNTSGRVVGAIFASNHTHKQFKPEDLELLNSFCSELSGAVARLSLEATLGNESSRSTSDSVSDLLHLYSTPERRHEQQKQFKKDQRQQEEHEHEQQWQQENKDGALTYSTAVPSRKHSLKRPSSLRFTRTTTYYSKDKDLIDWSFDPFIVDTYVLRCNFVRMLEMVNLIDRYTSNVFLVFERVTCD